LSLGLGKKIQSVTIGAGGEKLQKPGQPGEVSTFSGEKPGSHDKGGKKRSLVWYHPREISETDGNEEGDNLRVERKEERGPRKYARGRSSFWVFGGPSGGG